MATATVLFDRDCSLCQTLAQLAAKRAGGDLDFLSWQDYAASPPGVPAKLGVLTDGTLLEGEGAWAYLLGRHKDLAGLDWLAARLGLTTQTARVLQGAGDLLRRLCWRCRGR